MNKRIKKFLIIILITIIGVLIIHNSHRVETSIIYKYNHLSGLESIILGDVNNNGAVDENDIELLFKHVSASKNNNHSEWLLNDEEKQKVDINSNDRIDFGDIIFFIRYLNAIGNNQVALNHPDWLHEVSSIELSKTNISTVKQKSIAIDATVYPENAINKSLSWTSSNEEIATVECGVVTTIKPGEATIYAVADNKVQATCDIVVNPILPTKVTIDENKTISMGEDYSFNPTIEPSNADDKKIRYYVEGNDNIVEVDASGKIHGISSGTVTLKAVTTNNLEATCSVTVDTNVVKEEKMGYIAAIGHRYSNVDGAVPNPVSDGLAQSLTSVMKDGVAGTGDATMISSDGEFLLMDTFTGHGLYDLYYFIDNKMKHSDRHYISI